MATKVKLRQLKLRQVKLRQVNLRLFGSLLGVGLIHIVRWRSTAKHNTFNKMSIVHSDCDCNLPVSLLGVNATSWFHY